MVLRLADIVRRPTRVARGFAPKPPPPTKLSKIERDDRKVAGGPARRVRYATHHSGLEGENYIILEIGQAPYAGSAAKEVLFRVGERLTIHLLGGEQYFVPGASLRYDLPGSNPSAYKTAPADAWDTLRTELASSDGIFLRRVLVVKSSQVILDAAVDDWLDKHYGSVIDLSFDTARTKWEAVGRTRVTALFYAGQDLGQTGSRKYVNRDVAWCSEFAAHMIRHNGLPTPRGSIGTATLKEFFADRGRLFMPGDVDSGKYRPQPGDYVSLNGGGHSALFREWVGALPASGKIPPAKRFLTIEGNVGNAVRLESRSWSDVDAVGNAQ